MDDTLIITDIRTGQRREVSRMVECMKCGKSFDRRQVGESPLVRTGKCFSCLYEENAAEQAERI